VFRRASDGRWVGRVDVGHVDGKRKRVTVYGATEREVLGKLREVTRAFARPKSETSDRTVPVPRTAVAALMEHRHRQAEERDAAGWVWQDFGLVFPSSIGTPLEPRNLNRWFDELRRRADLPWLRLHDLRHAFATFMRDTGSDLTLIKETLGHSQISITANLHTHVLLPARVQASDSLDAALFGGAEMDQDGPDDDAADPPARRR
jgi:integrase